MKIVVVAAGFLARHVAGQETRRHRGIGNLRGSRPCRLWPHPDPIKVAATAAGEGAGGPRQRQRQHRQPPRGRGRPRSYNRSSGQWLRGTLSEQIHELP
jgi:hypothetical protein